MSEDVSNQSRRKLLATVGVTGAAIVSGGLVTAFSGPTHAAEDKQGPITDDADRISYQPTKDHNLQTVGNKLREFASVNDFGVIGDGITDDTTSLQAAIDYAIANEISLKAESSQTFLVSGLTINGPIVLEGSFHLLAKDMHQDYVILIQSKVDSRAEILINCAYKAMYGIKAENFGRSTFYHTKIERARLWGFQYNPVANNNFVQHSKLSATLCGARHLTAIQMISTTGNLTGSTQGYGTFAMNQPIPQEYLQDHSSYFILYKEKAYKIKSVTSQMIDVYNLDISNDPNPEIIVVVGGGLNIIKHGDNGVGTFGGLDILSNQGIGVHASSLYGHSFNNLVAQGNAIGFACVDYMLSATFIKPYFELNIADFVVYNYIQGTIIDPLMDISGIQRVIGHVLGGFHTLTRTEIITNDSGGMKTPILGHNNPSQAEVIPGYAHAFYKSSTTPQFKIRIRNEEKFDSLQARTIMIDYSQSNQRTTEILIDLAEDNGEVVEGNLTYSTYISSRNCMLKMYKVRNEWKVNVVSDETMTSIDNPPAKIGLIAVVAGVGYVSTGTSAISDWKPITE